MHYTKESAIVLSGMSKSDRARLAKEGVETRVVAVCDSALKSEADGRARKRERNKARRERRKETRVLKQGEVHHDAA